MSGKSNLVGLTNLACLKGGHGPKTESGEGEAMTPKIIDGTEVLGRS